MNGQEALGGIGDRLRRHIRTAPLPMLLVALPDGQALEASDAMIALIGRSREQALQTLSPDFTHDPATTRASLRMLADGSLDGYTRRIRMPQPSGASIALQVRVDACDHEGSDRLAVVTVLPSSVGPEPTGPVPNPARAVGRVTGTTAADGVIDLVVNSAADFLEAPDETVLNRSLLDLVHPADAGAVTLPAARANAGNARIAGRTRVRGHAGAWRAVRIELQPRAAHDDPERSAGLAFALVVESTVTASPPRPATDEPQDAAERLQRELHAASAAAHLNLVAAVMDSARVAGLTARERQVVNGILTGQRVAAIALELHLSQSTIRNHLTGAYRKLSVTSQSELLELLHPPPPAR